MIFHHLGIIVEDLQSGSNFLRETLTIADKSEVIIDEVIDVKIIFLNDISGICYELIAPLTEKSPIINSLNQRKNILNHVAYLVTDINQSIAELRRGGAIPVMQPTPAKAFDNRPVAFLLTKLGFIIELIQS